MLNQGLHPARCLLSIFAAGTGFLFAIAPAMAQDAQAPQITDSAVGQAGQRQTRAQAAPGIEPMARIDSRIRDRVDSRIENRLDRYFVPQGSAASSFAVAGQRRRATNPAVTQKPN
jgi:hypothetical protein